MCSCAFSNSGDRNNTNAVLGTLGYYGGPTPTIPLLTGSPAIDAGNPSGCTDGHGNLLKTDQPAEIRIDALAGKATSLKHATLRRQIPTRSVGRMLLPRPGFFQRYAC